MRRLSLEKSNNRIVSIVSDMVLTVSGKVSDVMSGLTLSVVPVSTDGPRLARPDSLPVAEIGGDPEPVPLALLVPLPAREGKLLQRDPVTNFSVYPFH